MYKYIQFQSTTSLDISLALRFKENKKPAIAGVSTNNKKFTIMAMNAKTAATKSRETKLGKKSCEELIQIILKKDKVENKLNAQINSLKTENKALQNRVASFDKDQEGNIKAINESKDKIATLNESLNASRLRIEELDNEVQKYAMASADANDRVSGLKALLVVSTMLAVVFGIALLF